jgi:uncharacterized protein (TIGR00251 family)
VSDSVVLDIKVTPRAGKTELAGTRDGTILVRLAAAPVGGAANTALIEFLSDLFDVPKRNIAIVLGASSRQKRVKITGITTHDVERCLARRSDRRER